MNGNSNPTDLLLRLLRDGSKITRVSNSPRASNGLPYCFVEVSHHAGTRYLIDANGKGPTVLYGTVIEIMKKYKEINE